MFLEDLSGQRFEKLYVLKKIKTDSSGRAVWLCLCDCGNEKVARSDNLKRGVTKSCGCVKFIKTTGKKRKFRVGVSDEERIIDGYINAALRRSLCWNITKEHAISMILSPCFYCGKISTRTIKGKEKAINGIDRIDNKTGYTNENTVPCCRYCNRAKGTMSKSGFMSWITSVYEYQNISRS